jgi:hypothetical protein
VRVSAGELELLREKAGRVPVSVYVRGEILSMLDPCPACGGDCACLYCGAPCTEDCDAPDHPYEPRRRKVASEEGVTGNGSESIDRLNMHRMLEDYE